MRLVDFIRQVTDLGLSRSDGYDMAAFILGIDYDNIKKDPFVVLDDSKAGEVLSRLKSGVPTAYITNRREFYGREFYVDENVLIPRVETEILVEAAVKRVKDLDNLRVLDLCTGSGCILVSILCQLGRGTGVGVDISSKALQVAKKNAEINSIDKNAEFIEFDATVFKPKSEPFDILVCNPPYLTTDEYDKVEVQVKKEPFNALVAEDNGLYFYKKILWNIPLLCKKNSAAFFEIGANQWKGLSDFAESIGIEVSFIQDYAGIKRVMVYEYKD